MNVRVIRNRAMHYISPNTATSYGISFEALREFISGTRIPPEENLRELAAHMGLSEKEIA